jgi:hypothetical protein
MRSALFWDSANLINIPTEAGNKHHLTEKFCQYFMDRMKRPLMLLLGFRTLNLGLLQFFAYQLVRFHVHKIKKLQTICTFKNILPYIDLF